MRFVFQIALPLSGRAIGICGGNLSPQMLFVSTGDAVGTCDSYSAYGVQFICIIENTSLQTRRNQFAPEAMRCYGLRDRFNPVRWIRVEYLAGQVPEFL